MFSASASRSPARAPACATSRSGVSARKCVRCRPGRALTATAPQRLRLRCTVESDVAQTAAYEATLFGDQGESATDNEDQQISQKQDSEQEGGTEQNVAGEGDTTFTLSNADMKRSLQKESQSAVSKLKVRDEVLIDVVLFQKMGATVNLVEHPPIQAFIPFRFYPVRLLSEVPYELIQHPPDKQIDRGTKRKALIYNLEPGLTDQKGGVVVTAWHYDRRVLFRRLLQIRELCRIGNEVVRGYILGRSKGGLLVVVAGFTCFLPTSYCTQRVRDIVFSNERDFKAHHIDSEVEVVIVDVEANRSRVVLSNIAAESTKTLRNLRIGSLIQGRVTDIMSYGVFVTINDSNRSGLLHVRNISKDMVQYPDEVFKVGERICALLIDVDPQLERFALSTADLEEERGEMLYNKDGVMRNAPAMAARLQQELESAREAHMAENHNPEQTEHVSEQAVLENEE